MAVLAALLEIQELDLAADAARRRSDELVEREALPRVAAALSKSEADLASVRTERAEAEAREEALATRVAEIAKAIEAAELERYSGKKDFGNQKDRDEAAAHAASQQALREEQTQLEEEELSLLESIEAIDARIADCESEIAGHREEGEKLAAAIGQVEREVEAERSRLAISREALAGSVPDEIRTVYERIRAQPRSGGRGATRLLEGRCGGCRIELPSLERKRMLAEPEDALIQCPQCRRVLVRGD